jgi:hypothetical protein
LPQLFPQNTSNAPAPIGIFDIDPKLRTPYYQQYGLNIQTQLSRGFLLEIGYVGARGEHLPVQTEANQALIASPTNAVNGVTTNNTGSNDSAAARAPFIGFSNSGFLFLQTSQTSNFNSLQTTITEKMGRATLLATYMYSKSLDTGSGTTDGTVFTTSSGDQTNPAQAYGPSNFNRTHHATVRFTQPLPNPHWHIARGNIGSRVFDGYGFSGTGIVQSGTPFEIDDAGGATFYGTDTSRGNYAVGATAKTAVLSGRTENRLNAYFNTAAFATATTLYGNTGRNILHGPLQRALDLSLTKTTHIRDSVNLTNTPNFNNPASDVGASSFGVITSQAGNPRILQFVLKLTY